MLLMANEFKVTETLQNGNERTITKTVYTYRFGKDGKFLTNDERTAICFDELKRNHYYKIEFVKAYPTNLLIVL